MDDEIDTADPAQAFDDLRGEVAVLRRAVEALPGAWRDNQPPDYTVTLGDIVKGLNIVAGRLEGIEKQPALKKTVEQYQQAVARTGHELMREAAQKLDRAAHDAAGERDELASMIGTVLTRDSQFMALLWTGLATLVIGVLMSPFIARVLPFGGDSAIAAFIMRGDRWNAGMALMQAASPEGWRDVSAAAALVRENSAAVKACSEAAAKAKKEQRCTIVVAGRS